MKSLNRLIATEWKGNVLTALWTDGQISRLSLDGKASPSLVNQIYVGKVKNIVKNIDAAFVEFGDGLTGYYSLAENPKHLRVSGTCAPDAPLKIGDELVVQVSKDAVKTKAPVLTGKISLSGRYVVLTKGKSGLAFSSKITDREWKEQMRERFSGRIPDGCSLIIRTNAYGMPADILDHDITRLENQLDSLLAEAGYRTCGSRLDKNLPSWLAGIRDLNSGMADEIVTDQTDLFEELKRYLGEYQKEDLGKLRFYEDRLLPLSKLYSLDTVMERALSRQVWLKSGGYLVIDPTEAMTVIDVNTGKYSGKKNSAETIRMINLEAAEEIGRQMSLRNLSGIILVDFIDMDKKENREELLERMREICRRDPIRTTVVDMTALNLIEITRKKLKKPLMEMAAAAEQSAGNRENP